MFSSDTFFNAAISYASLTFQDFYVISYTFALCDRQFQNDNDLKPGPFCCTFYSLFMPIYSGSYLGKMP